MDVKKFAGTIIINNNRILLVQESHKEAKGLWSFPLGSVDKNEKVEDCAIRETKEETGLEVSLNKKFRNLSINNQEFKTLSKFDKYIINLSIFKVDNYQGDIKKGKDILDVKWCNMSDITNLELRGEWMVEVIDYLKNEII